MSVFYDHLIGLDDLHQELLDFKLILEQHYQLLNMIDSALHHEVLAVCLDCVPPQHHESFIQQFAKEPNDPTLLVYLKGLDPEIENKIHKKGLEVKGRIKEDLKKLKN